ncbi:MAG TPA: leucine-rich repeat domain-containing protein [Ruminococcus sp.]|nr:leucine-rich repeat domain-containing protein [Ruminococcus sp.]
MKKLFTAVLAAAALLSTLPKITAKAQEPAYIYTIIGSEATVIGFSGEPSYIQIPETLEGCPVTEIRDNAFCECSSLKQISLPDTLTKIGHHCFYACTSLESVVIPDNVTQIGDGCFCGCTSLTAVSLPDSLSSLPHSCFRACTALREITLPAEALAVEDYCFSACTSLSKVNTGDRLRSLGDCSFYMCSSLESLYIPPSAEDIGSFAVGYVPTEKGSQTMEGFTVLGEKGSPAEDYARENDLVFVKASGAVQAMAAAQLSRKEVPYFYWFAAVWGAFAAVLALLLLRFIHQRSK